MDDGQEMEVGAGDIFEIPPGHDAWIVGDQPCVVIDWQGFGGYAKRLTGGYAPGTRGGGAEPRRGRAGRGIVLV